tara:strand:+ start:2637 stop:3122 length:486 start_codon:yes stop_codon:yes gene_type:complete
MSSIFGKGAQVWIDKHTKSGETFRAYWHPNGVDAILDPNQGTSLRYEWSYDIDNRKHGITKSWWNNGNLNQTKTFINGLLTGIAWFHSPLGDHSSWVIYKDGVAWEGLITRYSSNEKTELQYPYNAIIKQICYDKGKQVYFKRFKYFEKKLISVRFTEETL